jgi:histidinol-phosphate aminotransferase
MTGPHNIQPRPGVLGIEPYQGGSSALEGRDEVIKLASNEGALGPSPKAVAAFEAASAHLDRYPDGASTALREALGGRFGLDPARIICGAGSDEILALLARAYAGEGDEVLYSAHGFLVYPIAAQAVGAEPVKVPEAGLRADVDGFIARAGAHTRLVYLANPNNPTGSYLSGDELRRLRAGLPKGVMLVLDSAYAEFVTQADYEAGATLVDEYENTVMTRTFSKIFGLGNLRLGWAYGPAHVIDVLNRLRMPFNVSGAAIVHNTVELGRLTESLTEAGILVQPSAGNFVLARFPGGLTQAQAANDYLKSRGIIVRSMEAYGLPDSLRITIGLSSEVDAAAAVLAEFMLREGMAHG